MTDDEIKHYLNPPNEFDVAELAKTLWFARLQPKGRERDGLLEVKNWLMGKFVTGDDPRLRASRMVADGAESPEQLLTELRGIWLE